MRRLVAIAAALGLVVGVAGCGAEEGGQARPEDARAEPASARSEREGERRRRAPSPLAEAAPRRLRAPARRAPEPRTGHLVAIVRAGKRVPLWNRPGGRIVARVGHRTNFGSRTALTVLELRHGRRWIGVATPLRPHGRLGWIRANSSRLSYARTERSLHVDLSERSLELRDGERVLRRVRVGIGRPGTPTPRGRFGVTDRLLGRDFGWWYGCCIIAFSARQPGLPPGWRGGDRVAIHGAPPRSTIGAPSTAGCLRAGDAALRRLMVEVPLGAPIEIRA